MIVIVFFGLAFALFATTAIVVITFLHVVASGPNAGLADLPEGAPGKSSPCFCARCRSQIHNLAQRSTPDKESSTSGPGIQPVGGGAQ